MLRFFDATINPWRSLEAGAEAAKTLRALAVEFYAPIIPIVAELRQQGLSLRAIAAELDRRGVATRYYGHDGKWSATQVRRVLIRAAEEDRCRDAATATIASVATAAESECQEEAAEPPPRRPWFPPTTSDLR